MAAAAGHSTAVATIATVSAAVQSTWGDRGKLSEDKLGNPTEWYVADDARTHTRYFVIQGSDALDHWIVNLTFDPVIFEDASLGVKVGKPFLRHVLCMTADFQARHWCNGPEGRATPAFCFDSTLVV